MWQTAPCLRDNVLKQSYQESLYGLNFGWRVEILMLKFSVESLEQVMGRGVEIGGRKAISGLLACVFSSWKVCMEDCWSGNGGSSAIRTVWFLNLYSSRSQPLNFVVLTKYSPSWRRSDSYLAFSPWDDLQTKTVTSFHCYLPNNSKLCYSHKLTESLALSLPSAPDGFYHLMKPDSFFSPSFIIYY